MCQDEYFIFRNGEHNTINVNYLTEKQTDNKSTLLAAETLALSDVV